MSGDPAAFAVIKHMFVQALSAARSVTLLCAWQATSTSFLDRWPESDWLARASHLCDSHPALAKVPAVDSIAIALWKLLIE